LLQFLFLCFDLVDFVLCGASFVPSWIGGDIQLQCSDGIIVTLRTLAAIPSSRLASGHQGHKKSFFERIYGNIIVLNLFGILIKRLAMI